jgi:hypothetical protein
MAKRFSHIDESLREFIDKQAMFFVATAPTEGGRINLSPAVAPNVTLALRSAPNVTPAWRWAYGADRTRSRA